MTDRTTSHRVTITTGARQDLRDIIRWIADHDAPLAAERLLDELQAACQSLATLPERGAHPPELLALGIRRYRQVVFKPWRIVYRVIDDQVVVLLIADSRRNLKTLFERRLLAP